MSKYIIELGEEANMVQAINVTQNRNVYVSEKYVTELEELTADYINEHFGELQDTAYQKGFEDGKKEAESSEAIEQAKADTFNKGMLFKEEKINDAFKRGFEKGKAVNDIGYKDGVNDGRNEAWEAARKIVLSPDEGGTSLPDLFAMFGNGSTQSVFRNYSASEAIAKLKAYEEKQEADEDDKIEVGDEVRPSYSDIAGVVTLIDDETIYVLWRDGSSTSMIKLKEVRKTGRHFDIASILEAMKHD